MVHQADKYSLSADAKKVSYALHPDTVIFINQALSEDDVPRVKGLLSSLHMADIAEYINQVSPSQRAQFVQILQEEFDPELLLEIEPEIRDEVIDQLGIEETAAVITKLNTDDAVQIVGDLEDNDQLTILNAMPEKERGAVVEGLAFPEETAGRRMDASFIAIPSSWTVGATIDWMRQHDDLSNDYYSLFVVDDNEAPKGYVPVSRLMHRQRDVVIKNIMETDVKIITPAMDQEEVAYIFRKYGLVSAPVVDDNGALKAVITIDDVVDIIQEEAEEDITRLGGVDGSDLYSTSIETAMHRFPWLFVNLLTAIGASAIIMMFDASIEKLVALAVLMPIVASMAGNAGTQTLTIAVRALAMRELTATNAMRVVGKEMVAAMVNGVLFAAVVIGASFFFYNNIHLSLVFGAATFVSLAIAALAGAMIPLVLARFGWDPAVSSVVFLTTITDMSAFFIFLGLATWLIL